MNSREHIQDELRSLGSDLPAGSKQPFLVPDGYFDGLPAAVLAKIKELEVNAKDEIAEFSPLLAGISKQMPFTVPAAYFEENLVNASEITRDEEPAFLAGVSKSMPYQVPVDYFKSLPDQLLKKVEEPKAKVIPLFSRSWMKIAAAAVIGGALFFGGYQLFSGNNTEISPSETATIPDTTNKQLAQNNIQPFDKEIKLASTKDLEEFIETVEVSAAKAPGKSTKDSQTDEVKDLLKDISVTEMESFLSSLPTADDDLLITD